jgi:hypothetical protein
MKETTTSWKDMRNDERAMTLLGFVKDFFRLLFFYSFRSFSLFVSLGRMGWKWSEFSSSDQQKMEEEISKDMTDCNIDLVAISAYLNCFLTLDYPLRLKQLMKDSLFIGLPKRKIDHRDSRQVANIIYSLGKLGIVWKELPREVQGFVYHGIELCCSFFDSQGISNLILG